MRLYVLLGSCVHVLLGPCVYMYFWGHACICASGAMCLCAFGVTRVHVLLGPCVSMCFWGHVCMCFWGYVCMYFWGHVCACASGAMCRNVLVVLFALSVVSIFCIFPGFLSCFVWGKVTVWPHRTSLELILQPLKWWGYRTESPPQHYINF